MGAADWNWDTYYVYEGGFTLGHDSVGPLECMAGTTGLEPATSAVTGQRSNQLSYVPTIDGVGQFHDSVTAPSQVILYCP